MFLIDHTVTTHVTRCRVSLWEGVELWEGVSLKVRVILIVEVSPRSRSGLVPMSRLPLRSRSAPGVRLRFEIFTVNLCFGNSYTGAYLCPIPI